MRPCSQTWHKATAVGDTTKKLIFMALFRSFCFSDSLQCAVLKSTPTCHLHLSPGEAADEWLGKGALASLRFAQEGQVRLPACLQARSISLVDTGSGFLQNLHLVAGIGSTRTSSISDLGPFGEKQKNTPKHCTLRVLFALVIQDFLTANLRICTRLARLPQVDELSDPRSPARSSSSRDTGPFQVFFAEENF